MKVKDGRDYLRVIALLLNLIEEVYDDDSV